MPDPLVLLKPTSQFSPDLLKRLFAFRHTVFVERLRWVPARGAEEVDFFDTLNPHHVVGLDQGGGIVAAARLLPTSGPSMLRDVFPSLLGGTPCPQSEDVWEISRFALCPTPGDRLGHRRALRALVEQLFAFAQGRGIRRLVAVSDVRLERLVADTMGVPIHRFAPPQRIGSDWAVAGWATVPPANAVALSIPADQVRPCGCSVV